MGGSECKYQRCAAPREVGGANDVTVSNWVNLVDPVFTCTIDFVGVAWVWSTLSELFAYPNGSRFPLGQRGSDNRGWTVLLLLCNDYRFDHSLVIKNFYPNHCAVFIGAYAYDKLILFGNE